MKNLNYFPFERNKYYYGKLLTEQNFIQEQKYFNDKRRMQNHFLHGEGVAAGLNVIQSDEKSISVEAGIAIDFTGREIVVYTPAVKKLSMIDGFDKVTGERGREYVYLCIEYAETDVEQSYNIAGSGVFQADHVDYDKTREGYHLYITEKEPERSLITPESLYEQIILLYEGNGIRISQKVPLFIKSGSNFETSFVIENLGAAKEISVSITEELQCASFYGEHSILLEYKSLLLERFGKMTKSVTCKAMELSEGVVRFRVEAPGFSVMADQRNDTAVPDGKEIKVPITVREYEEELISAYIANSMEEAVSNSNSQGIYLAKIKLVKTGTVYLIEQIETMPFRQYIYSSLISMSLFSQMKNELVKLKQSMKEVPGKSEEDHPAAVNQGVRMAQGKVTFDLGIGGKRGQRYKSAEMYHGLGLLPVQITLAMETGTQLFSGSSEVFLDMPVLAELAVKQDVSRGSFEIGVRLLESSVQRTLTIQWTAFAGAEEKESKAAEKQLYIKPGLLQLKPRESHYLEAVDENGNHHGVIWSVQTKNGGMISQDGLYAAPNNSGVYEIIAQSKEDEELKTSLYAIVREE